MNRTRSLVTVSLVLLVALGILNFPFPRRVVCALELRPRDAQQIFVHVPGQLVDVLVEPGETVSAGQTLARLENMDLMLELVTLEGEKQEYEKKLLGLEHQRFSDAEAGEELPQVRQTLAAIEDQIREKQKDLAQLELFAPADGQIIAPARRRPRKSDQGMLPEWSGSPLDKKNLGARLAASELLCEVGDPNKLEAALIIDQSEIERVQVGQKVRIKLDAWPGRVFEGEIAEIGKERLRAAPQSLSNQAGGELATRTDASGVVHPLSTSYIARVPLEGADVSLRLGFRGRARIETGSQTPAAWIWRELLHTFHFRL